MNEKEYSEFVNKHDKLKERVQEIFKYALRREPDSSIDRIDFDEEQIAISYTKMVMGHPYTESLNFPPNLIWARDWQEQYDSLEAKVRNEEKEREQKRKQELKKKQRNSL